MKGIFAGLCALAALALMAAAILVGIGTFVLTPIQTAFAFTGSAALLATAANRL